MMVDRYDGYELTKCSNGGIVLYEDYQKLENQLADLKERLRWIPVSERLPEYDDEVECGYCVTLPDGKQVKIVYIGSLNDYGDWIFLNSLGEYHTLCMPIQFWREIPELEDGE